MAIFVDASALIAMIVGEPDATSLSDRLERDSERLCSTASVWEAVAGLARSYRLTVAEARDRTRVFVDELDLRFVPMSETEFEFAVEAFARFGKGRHPAALNMGDCLAYACARSNGARLLFKGDDFSKTDIEQA